MSLFEFLETGFDPVVALGLAAFSVLLFALPLCFWAASSGKNSSLVKILVILANFLLTAQLTIRWWQSGHFPISNLYESLCFLTWSSTLAQLLVEKAWSSPIIPATVTPLSLLLIGFASFALPEHLQEASPLVPALKSSWLVMHVSVIMTSYAALLVGSLLSLSVIIIDNDKELRIRSSSLGTGIYKASNINESSKNNISFNFTRLEKLDWLSYRTITFGFLLLTIGLISGAVWANEAWGSWWSWDPKETWALICWLVYAAYLHTRLSRGWQGRRSAILAVAGFMMIFICYIGVNLLGVGLHSYGWFLTLDNWFS